MLQEQDNRPIWEQLRDLLNDVHRSGQLGRCTPVAIAS